MDGTFPVATTGAPKSGATKSSKLAAGPIAGIAVGAVAAIIIVVLLIIYFKRRRAVEDQSGGALVQKAPSVQEVEGRAVLHAQNSFQRCDPGPAPPIPPRL